jgi:hypothetical protein
MKIEHVAIDRLKRHPRNYRDHPEEQLAHIEASLREHGFYRNVVVARDDTILGGHGVVQAAKRIGMDQLPVLRLDLDPDDPAALRILVGDNELGRFADDDDRELTELLRELATRDALGLMGTGYDAQQLAALLLATRTRAEITGFDSAAEWVGMPDYEVSGESFSVVVNFAGEDARAKFIQANGLVVFKSQGTYTAWWPPRERDDRQSVRWESGAAE